LDNSEWMRNGDYTPSRIEAQSDATIFLFNAKTRSNPENTVGMITMAGKRYLKNIIFKKLNYWENLEFKLINIYLYFFYNN